VERAAAVPLVRFDQPLDAWDGPEDKRRKLNLLATSMSPSQGRTS